MKIKSKKIKWLILFVFTMVIGCSISAQEIKWYSIDSGGGISTDNNQIELIGVIGQSDSIRIRGEDISLSAGYLPLPPLSDNLFKDSFE